MGGSAPFWTSSYSHTLISGSSSHIHTWPIAAGNPPLAGGTFLGETHHLTIVNHAEDYGQDGYEEDLDWSIEHHLNCEKSMHPAVEIKQLKYSIIPQNTIPSRLTSYDATIVFECPMAQEIQAYRLERLSGLPWTDLEPGTYKIALEQAQAGHLYQNTGYPPSDPPKRIVLL
jgi:hypothetical protein